MDVKLGERKMQINEKTGKPFGYHVKGKTTLVEFCVQQEYLRCIDRRNCIPNEIRYYELNFHVVPSIMQTGIERLEKELVTLNEKIAFYKWMLH